MLNLTFFSEGLKSTSNMNRHQTFDTSYSSSDVFVSFGGGGRQRWEQRKGSRCVKGKLVIYGFERFEGKNSCAENGGWCDMIKFN